MWCLSTWALHSTWLDCCTEPGDLLCWLRLWQCKTQWSWLMTCRYDHNCRMYKEFIDNSAHTFKTFCWFSATGDVLASRVHKMYWCYLSMQLQNLRHLCYWHVHCDLVLKRWNFMHWCRRPDMWKKDLKNLCIYIVSLVLICEQVYCVCWSDSNLWKHWLHRVDSVSNCGLKRLPFLLFVRPS